MNDRGKGVQLALDDQLEGKKGSTILRLVHSGIGIGSDWDDEYAPFSRGWKFELRSLKHHLERHPDEARKVVWAKRPVPVSAEVAWDRLAGASPGEDLELDLAHELACEVLHCEDPACDDVSLDPGQPDLHLFSRDESVGAKWK